MATQLSEHFPKLYTTQQDTLIRQSCSDLGVSRPRITSSELRITDTKFTIECKYEPIQRESGIMFILNDVNDVISIEGTDILNINPSIGGYGETVYPGSTHLVRTFDINLTEDLLGTQMFAQFVLMVTPDDGYTTSCFDAEEIVSFAWTPGSSAGSSGDISDIFSTMLPGIMGIMMIGMMIPMMSNMGGGNSQYKPPKDYNPRYTPSQYYR